MTAEAAPTYALTDADHDLIDRARSAFRTDFRYLEEVLWAYRTRLEQAELRSAVAEMLWRLRRVEPRLVKYVSLHPSGCWLWTGSTTGAGQPVLRFGPEHRQFQVRRVLWEAEHGRILGARRAFASGSCQALCVSPDHTMIGARAYGLRNSAH